MLRASALLPLFLVVAACGAATPEQAAAPAPAPADPAPINQLRNDFLAAYNAGDAAAIAALYAEDAVYQPDHGPAVEGRAAIQQYFEQVFATVDVTTQITPGETEIVGDMAHEHGTFMATATPKAGGDPMMTHGKYLVIAERGADGVWRLVHDIDNSSDPEPGAN